MAKYKILVELEYPPNRVVQAGEIVSDLPAKSIKWLTEQNMVELVGDKTVQEVTETEEK